MATDADDVPPGGNGARDPFGYEPGDRVGIALDVDGTLYRGSIFVETLAYLPYVTDLPMDREDRAARRTALLTIAEYGGGESARKRWGRLLTALDAVARVGGGRLAARVMHRLARADADRGDPERDPDDGRDGLDYETMQRRILDAYGEILAGTSRTTVDRAVSRVVHQQLTVDEADRQVLASLQARPGVDPVLVTHAPEGIARAYADRLLGDPDRVVATRYATDDRGRYTGAYEKPAKGGVVAGLVADRDWDYVVAAGDSGVDLAMADRANCFLAVTGEGDLSTHLDDRETVTAADPTHLRDRLGDGCRIVAVGGVEATVPTLRRVLSVVGIED